MTETKTPEKIIEHAMTEWEYEAFEFRVAKAVEALRAAGLLVSAPTGDEREGMRKLIAQGSYARTPDELPYADVADRLWAAGFRLVNAGTEPTEDLPLCGYCGDDLGATECPTHGSSQSEPTDKQVEAAAKVIRRKSIGITSDPDDFWSDASEMEKEAWLAVASAALKAANAVAAVTPEPEWEYGTGELYGGILFSSHKPLGGNPKRYRRRAVQAGPWEEVQGE